MMNEPPAVIGETSIRAEPAGVRLEELDAYERSQRKRTLSYILWVALFASVILGVFDIQFKTWGSVIALFVMAALCLPALVLNRLGSYVLSASILSLIILVVITINLYDGDGVRDPGLMAYPTFLLVGTLLFGRRAAPYFLAAAAISLAAIVVMELSGVMHPVVGPTRLSILIPLITLLGAATGVVWVIVHNLERNFERAKRSEAELRENYDLTLQAWAKVMEYRDRETEGHSRRLVDLGTKLAQALRMSEAEITHLQRGALLHDIGKLAIPDDILLKPGPLDEEEQRIMRQHPVYARQMLMGIPFLAASLPVAFSHHERWDGQGYPEGLKGEDIPLIARLFAVVDTWDALNSERVYRAAWPREQIRAYLKENAGKQFDPQIVEVFLAMQD